MRVCEERETERKVKAIERKSDRRERDRKKMREWRKKKEKRK